MRTTIDLDDELIAEAMAVSGLPTREAAVEEALRRMVRSERQRRAITNMRGVGWEGDLDALRTTRSRK